MKLTLILEDPEDVKIGELTFNESQIEDLTEILLEYPDDDIVEQ